MRSASRTHAGGWSRLYRAGATRPVSRRVCLRRRTHASLTAYFAATARVPAPASQSARTLTRKSIEYARIAPPPVMSMAPQ